MDGVGGLKESHLRFAADKLREQAECLLDYWQQLLAIKRRSIHDE